jgi:hypothetical protein
MITRAAAIDNIDFLKQLNDNDQLDNDTLNRVLTEVSEYLIYGGRKEIPKYSTFEEYWKAILPVLWNVREWDNDTIKSWIECTFVDSRR